MYIETSLKPDY